MARVFSIEDGNISKKPIITSQNRTYTDVDLSFKKKNNGELFKKTDAAAVKQAVKNLLLTNLGEKPFRPFYGGDLNRFLFNLSEEFDEIEIEDTIASAMAIDEPRAQLQSVKSVLSPDYNSVQVTVNFQVVSTQEPVELNITLARLR
jgi:phage baseplate assembly protein W|tara:strand:- start:84 stop:524 length:441 start_codon:yes stop_codon:yes gene_type:complete